MEMVHPLKLQSLPPVTYFLCQGHSFQTYPESATNWESNILTSEHTGVILIQTISDRSSHIS